LFPLVYEELRRIAAAKMAKAAPGQTLQATALVHEAWLRLVGMEQPSWTSRRHFFRTAALAMQQILVDVARRKQAKRHGGGLERVNIEDVDLASATGADEFLRVHEALERLTDEDPEKAEIVRLRCLRR